MKLFNNKSDKSDKSDAGSRFQTIISLVKDLDENELKNLLRSMKLVWQSYNAICNNGSKKKKGMDEIDCLEEEIEREEDD